MGRRKIRCYGLPTFELKPEEILGFPFANRSKIRLEDKPRLGPGSGRAGGARSSTHKLDHILRGRVYPDTTVEICPICRYGIRVWDLWTDSGSGIGGEKWAAYWEGREDEREEFERFVNGYELREKSRIWDSVDEAQELEFLASEISSEIS